APLIRRVPIVLLPCKALPARGLDHFVPVQLPSRHAAGRGLDTATPIDAGFAVHAEADQERRPTPFSRLGWRRELAISRQVKRRPEENRRDGKSFVHPRLLLAKIHLRTLRRRNEIGLPFAFLHRLLGKQEQYLAKPAWRPLRLGKILFFYNL